MFGYRQSPPLVRMQPPLQQGVPSQPFPSLEEEMKRQEEELRLRLEEEARRQETERHEVEEKTRQLESQRHEEETRHMVEVVQPVSPQTNHSEKTQGTEEVKPSRWKQVQMQPVQSLAEIQQEQVNDVSTILF